MISAAASRARAVLWSSTRLSTWAPRRRTHLLCVFCASVLTLILAPENPEWAGFEVAGGLAVAVVSVRPVAGGVLSLLTLCAFHVVSRGGGALPSIGPWLCAPVLLTRGFHRAAAYGLVAASAAVQIVFLCLFLPDYSFADFDLLVAVLGCGCLVVAELMRRPRTAADAAAERYQEDLERQRLLVVFELHDTVVRDLTRAAMLADQARLAQPPDAPLGPELAAMAGSVRTAVEQLRANLRAISGAAGAAGTADRPSAAGAAGTGLDVLASSAPRPLAEVVAETRTVLAGRGVTLETEGLELLEARTVPPGVRQQLVRVLSELASNMTKYAAPGSARIIVDSDERSLEAMAANAAPAAAPGRADGPVSAVSSGLGLTGARRRVESLGGIFNETRTAERFTVVLSVPLSR